MTPRDKEACQTPSQKIQQPDPKRPSWLQRIRKRVAMPVPWAQLWQNVQSRHTTDSKLAVTKQALVRYIPSGNHDGRQESNKNVPLATRVAQFGRRFSTPVQNYRPSTAPPNPTSIPFRPVRWELRRENTSSPDGSAFLDLKIRCPYDPEMLQFFGNFQASSSICGLGSTWPWSTKRQIPTPCDDCLQGTERAHINVSPSRLSRRRSSAQQRRGSARNSREDVPNRPVEQVSWEIHDSHPCTAQTPQLPWQRSLQTSSTWNLGPTRPPERMGYRNESDIEATFNRLRQVVENARTSPSHPRSPPPKLHQLSPDIAFIHRSEVASHQAAIREGRHSPILDHQAQGGTPVDVIGYTFNRTRKDSSSTALYSEANIPGEYIPPSPSSIPAPTRVFSPFRRRSIELSPVPRPVLISRLYQPPFVPALPPGIVLRPVNEWGRPHSAPEHWESVLRHSAVYRARDTDHSPRVPSPLHERHGPQSFDSNWSHGTMPLDERDVEELDRGFRQVNGNVKEPRMRGGGIDDLPLGVFMRGEDVLWHWNRWNESREEDPEKDPEITPPYVQRMYEGQRINVCLQPTTQLPRLRGGGGKPDRRPNRIPTSLLYLAGSTGRKPEDSITVEEWNRMKPKKRMGGLLGMAVFGNKGGKPYLPNTGNQEVQTERESEPVKDARAGTGTPAASPTHATSPTPTPALEPQSGEGGDSNSNDAPAPDDIHDAEPNKDEEPDSKSAPEPAADKAPTPAPEPEGPVPPSANPAPYDSTTPTPETAADSASEPTSDSSPGPKLKDDTADDQTTPADTTPSPAPATTPSDAKDAPAPAPAPAPDNSSDGKAPPYPTTPPGNQPAGDGNDGDAKGGNVQMPATPTPTLPPPS